MKRALRQGAIMQELLETIETAILKLSAASCGESSILKRNKPSVTARLPRSKLRGGGPWLAGGFRKKFRLRYRSKDVDER